VISHCGFDLCFPDEAFFFRYPLAICMSSFEKCLFRSIALGFGGIFKVFLVVVLGFQLRALYFLGSA
jgi:hypothetical protein